MLQGSTSRRARRADVRLAPTVTPPERFKACATLRPASATVITADQVLAAAIATRVYRDTGTSASATASSGNNPPSLTERQLDFFYHHPSPEIRPPLTIEIPETGAERPSPCAVGCETALLAIGDFACRWQADTSVGCRPISKTITTSSLCLTGRPTDTDTERLLTYLQQK